MSRLPQPSDGKHQLGLIRIDIRVPFIRSPQPRSTKGVECDAVVVADVGAIDVMDPVAANACYVAVSRPRESLSLFMTGMEPSLLSTLVTPAAEGLEWSGLESSAKRGISEDDEPASLPSVD